MAIKLSVLSTEEQETIEKLGPALAKVHFLAK